MKPAVRSTVAAGALVFAAVSVGLVIAEVALRVTRLAPAKGLHTVNQAEFDAVPGLFSPGQSLIDWRHRSLPHRVTINSLGYRSPEFPREKPHGEFRILVIGDSFTYGDFVDDENTLPALLEGEMLRACSNVRVVNAGVGGTTVVSHAAMAARGGVIDPDLVLLMFYENDVADLMDPLWPQLESNRKRKSEFPINLVYGSVRDLALWNFAQRTRAVLRARRNPAPPAGSHGPGRPDEPRAEYGERLRTLRDSLKSEGTPLVVTAFPDHNTIYRDTAAERIRWFAEMAEASAVPYIDIFTPLVDSGLERSHLYLMPHDGHASAEGNRIAAARIAANLLLRQELAEHCRGERN